MHNCKVCQEEFEEWIYPRVFLAQNYQAVEQHPITNMCPSCYGWWEHVGYRSDGDRTRNNERVARIDGVAYVIGSEDLSQYEFKFRGYGGRRFVISFYNGDIITTTNLWCHGDIPDRFKSVLPDNAQFITEEPIAA